MTIIAAYYYNEGKRVREIRLDEHVELNENRSGFCWIALSLSYSRGQWICGGERSVRH